MNGLHKVLSIITVGLLAVSLQSCGVKKNTAANRNYQAFITRYNVFFNGKEHYNQTLADMEKNYRDDYSRLLPIHPAETRGNNDFSQPDGSFSRSIEKSQKAIQLHSIKRRPKREPGHKNDPEYQAWMRREEYNPFLHNAWMLMAESQFMDGDFLGAASTFFYITNHFGWLPETVTEARIWLARSYCAAGRVNEADAVLKRVKSRDLTSLKLQGFYSFVHTQIDLKRNQYAEAQKSLPLAIKTSSGHQRDRLRYLLGQLYLRNGDYDNAEKEFATLEKSIGAPHDLRFNSRIRRSEAIVGADAPISLKEKELKSLRALTRYESNATYLDQLYYAIGNLQLSMKDTVNAKKSYETAIALSERQSTDMAVALIALGNLYFTESEYDKAQPCLSRAIGILPDNYPELKNLRMKSDILDKLAVYSNTIKTNDSLLRLASLPIDEINRIIDKKIEALKKQDRERARVSESATQSPANGLTSQSNIFIPVPGADNSWYFYNPTLREAGKQEFRRRWGNRKQEDNWRRSDRTVSYNSLSDSLTAGTVDGITLNHPDSVPDVYSHEYYMSGIPFEQSQKERLVREIADALFEMGMLLKNELEDYASARKAWLRFLSDYPADIRRKDIYSNLYLMAMREGKNGEGEKWRNLIVDEYPASEEGLAMKDPRFLENLQEMNSRQESLYDDTYRAYLANDNARVRKNVDFARENYPMSALIPKFLFLEALTYATEGDRTRFGDALRQIAERYPDADVAPLSLSWLEGIESGRELHLSTENARGWMSTRLSNDSLPTTIAIERRLEFEFDSTAPHLVLITFPVNEFDPNEVLFNVARFNFGSFTVRDFDISLLQYGNLGLIKVGGFKNVAEGRRYESLISTANPPAVSPHMDIVIISESDFNLLQAGGRSLVDYMTQRDRKTDEEVHRAVLPDD